MKVTNSWVLLLKKGDWFSSFSQQKYHVEVWFDDSRELSINLLKVLCPGTEVTGCFFEVGSRCSGQLAGILTVPITSYSHLSLISTFSSKTTLLPALT